jgi:DNA-binding IclR family transcriptional regulator
MSDDDRYIIPSVDRTFDVLEYLAREPEGKNITDIASELDISKNSVFRILKTLTKKGYVEEYKRLYRLGSKLFKLGTIAVGESSLIEKSLYYMRDLRDEVGETVLLGKRVGTVGVILEQVPGTHPVKVMVEVGFHFPLHCSAPGKVFLANLPEKEAEDILAKLEYEVYTEKTINTREMFEAALKEAKEKGYAVDNEEEVIGVTCVSCPLFNSWGYPVAALWVTGPTARLSEDNFEEVGGSIAKYAEKISSTLGYGSS